MTDKEITEKIDEYWPWPNELSPDDKTYLREIVKWQIEEGDPDPVHTAVNAWTNELYPTTGVEIMAAKLRSLSKKEGSK